MNRKTIEGFFVPAALETLEPRIAPANYFIGSGGEVVGADGHEIAQAYQAGWASALGASSAYLFMKGDTLGYDSNGNGKFDKGERIVLSVKSGGAVFFLNTQDDGSEIAVVAASDGFGGKLSGVVGDIITSFGIEGFTHVQDADIRKLTIDGYMREGAGIWAGGEVRGVTITGADPLTKVSASSIVAGFDESDFKIGEVAFIKDPMNSNEGPGAGVSKIWSAGSIQTIKAGAGADQSGLENQGDDGGSIKNVTMLAGVGDIRMIAGTGGNQGNYGPKKATMGGDIANISISNLAASTLRLTSGNRGGAVSNIGLFGSEVEHLSIAAGNGDGGIFFTKGGDVKNVSIDVTHVGHLEIAAGYGGTASILSLVDDGKDGGSISNIHVLQKGELKGMDFESVNTVDSVTILAGVGGATYQGGRAGDGGFVSKISIPFSTTLNIKAGNGGSAYEIFHQVGGPGIAGAGGNLSQVVALLKSSPDSSEKAEITISAGDAGLGGPAAGGNLDNVIVASRVKGAGNVEISAGDGSHGAEGFGYTGGDGGNLRKALVLLPELDRIALLAGNGGSGMATNSKNPVGASGGTGGSLKTAYIFSNNAEVVEVKAGNGGDGTQSGYGGDGGELKDFTLSGLFADLPEPGIFSHVTIWAGKGGSADGPEGVGGDGGSLAKIIGPTINTYENLDLAPGKGGTGSLTPGKDGKSSNVQITSPSQFVASIEE